MNCTNCGATLGEGVSFCTNCGAPVAHAAGEATELGASLESAVKANQGVVDSVEAHAEIADEAAARWAEAEAEAMNDAQFPSGAPQAPAGFQPPSYNQPEPPQGAQPAVVAAPFYQADASPNAHYSSQRSYEQNAYGQDTGQPGGYQQPSYGQPAGYQAPQQVWPQQSATNRAFAMVLYVSGLLGLIFALVVRDQNDEFITHHLNNNVVILIGAFIGSFLSVIGIGFILLIYLLVMVIMGIISAYHGDMKELPLIGKLHIVK